MELVELPAMTPAARAELYDGEANPFGLDGLQWRESDRYLALRDDDGRLVAAAGLVVAEVEVAAAGLVVAQIEVGAPFPVVGVGGVIVTHTRRGQGLMRRVMDAALAHAAGLGPAFAMLFCSPENSRRYARMGFTRIAAPVTADQPDGAVTMPELAMWRPLRGDATWPDGAVRVLGLPF